MPNKILCPTHFYFGDQDWMDSSGAKRLIKGNRLPEGSTFDIIQDAGHNINLDNP
jgi:pimeloyl-ACP methyl ester carboxylesterase